MLRHNERKTKTRITGQITCDISTTRYTVHNDQSHHYSVSKWPRVSLLFAFLAAVSTRSQPAHKAAVTLASRYKGAILTYCNIAGVKGPLELARDTQQEGGERVLWSCRQQ